MLVERMMEPDPDRPFEPSRITPEKTAAAGGGALLAKVLMRAVLNDTNYKERYGDVLRALAVAHDLGYRAGIKIDPKEPAWPVVYIDLPDDGQLSWHMPEYAGEWDGHTTAEKFARIVAYAERTKPQ